MLLIEIAPLGNGGHRNQSGPEIPVPEGWAVVPESLGTMDTLEHFPFGEITVGDADGVPTVTGWTPLPIPEPEEPDLPEVPEPDTGARLEALERETAAISAAIERGLSL